MSVKAGDSEDLVLLNRLDSPMIVDGIKSDAHLAAVRRSGKRVSAVFVSGAKWLSINRTELVSASSPVTLAMALCRGTRSLAVKCDEPTELRLKVEPRIFQGTVKLDGRRLSPTDFAFDHEAGTLTLKLKPGEHKVEVRQRT